LELEKKLLPRQKKKRTMTKTIVVGGGGFQVVRTVLVQKRSQGGKLFYDASKKSAEKKNFVKGGDGGPNQELGRRREGFLSPIGRPCGVTLHGEGEGGRPAKKKGNQIKRVTAKSTDCPKGGSPPQKNYKSSEGGRNSFDEKKSQGGNGPWGGKQKKKGINISTGERNSLGKSVELRNIKGRRR